jgi:predicted SprT family Zn-dependent metalloprotease
MKKDSTLQAYKSLYKAFAFFNKELFGNKLPEPFLSYNAVKNTYGYFAPERIKPTKKTGAFSDSNTPDIHVISINPQYIGKRTDKQVLSTLVHEMVHLKQQIEGKPGKNGYHNKQWANMMKEIGLQPTNTGKKGGKETGINMTHMIVKGDRFDVCCDELLKDKFSFDYKLKVEKKKQKVTKKSKYVCAANGVTVWGKPGLNIRCGDSNELFEEF